MAQMEEGSKKRRQRRSYTDEFRAGAVRLVLDEGKTVSRVAQDLDLTASSLAHWVKQARADRSKGKTGLTTEERAELAQLRRENRTLRLERDILKKLSGAGASCWIQKLRLASLTAPGRSGRLLTGASEPVKKHGPGVAADLKVVTPSRRSRLGK